MPEIRFVRAEQAAEILGVSRSRLYELKRNGALVEGLHWTKPRGLSPRYNVEMLHRYLARDDEYDVQLLQTKGRKGRQGCKVNLAA